MIHLINYNEMQKKLNFNFTDLVIIAVTSNDYLNIYKYFIFNVLIKYL